MDRRNFIAMVGAGAGAIFAGGAGIGFGGDNFDGGFGDGQHFGWVPSPEATRQFVRSTDRPYYSQWQNPTGAAEGKQVMLLQAYEKVTGKKFQAHRQTVGDCCSHASSLCAEVLSTVQILNGHNSKWVGKYSTEYNYAYGRVIAGNSIIRRADGSTGAFSAKTQLYGGNLLRDKYGDIDLTEYSGARARDWGRAGVGPPEQLIPIAKKNVVRTASIITSADQAAEAILSGYTVCVCSNQGFSSVADRDGVMRADRTWYHAMSILGFDYKSQRRTFYIQNSWGNYCQGSERHPTGTFEGGFHADRSVVDYMLRQGDSYVYSDIVGYPRRRLDYILV